MKQTNLGTRLLSLFLAVVLVIGFIPVTPVSAEGETNGATTTVNSTFTLTVTRTIYTPTTPDSGEGTGGDNTGSVDSGDGTTGGLDVSDPSATTPTYTYTAAAKVNDSEVTGVTYSWTSHSNATGVTLSNVADTSATVKATLPNGLSLTATCSSDTAVTANWSSTAPNLTIYKGIPFAAPVPEVQLSTDYVWKVSSVTGATSNNDNTYTVATNATENVAITYNCVKSGEENSTFQITYTYTPEAVRLSYPTTIYRNVLFEVPTPTIAPASGYEWKTTVVGATKQADSSKYLVNTADITQVTITHAVMPTNAAADTSAVYTTSSTINVTEPSAPIYTVKVGDNTLDSTNSSITLTSDATITVTATLGQELVSPGLPALDGFSNWTKTDMTYTTTCQVTATDGNRTTKTFAVDNVSYSVTVDKVKPTVSVTEVYKYGGFIISKGTHVSFNISNLNQLGDTVNYVGIKKADATDYESLQITNDGKYSYTFDNDWVNSYTIKVTTSLGHETVHTDNVDEAANLSVAFTPNYNTNQVGLTDGIVYDPNATMTISISGASGSGKNSLNTSATKVKFGDNEVTGVSWEYKDSKWVATVDPTNATDLNNLTVYPVVTINNNHNSDGDTASYSSVTNKLTFGVDNTAPVVSIGQVEAGEATAATVDNVTYYNGEVKYTVTVTDEQLSTDTISYTIAKADGSSETKAVTEFTLNGNKRSYTITIKNGEKLTNITANATDLHNNAATEVSGNYQVEVDTTAPEVTVTASENVKYFYNRGSDVFLVMPTPFGPGYEGEAAVDEQISLTITVEEKNFVNDGSWTYANGKYTKTLDFNTKVHESLQWTGSFKVLDLVGYIGNTATITLTNGNKSENNFVATSPLAPATDGTYSFTYNIDRRTPDDVTLTEILKAPTVTLTPVADTWEGTATNGNKLYKDSVTFDLNVDDIYVEVKDDPTTDVNETDMSDYDAGITDAVNLYINAYIEDNIEAAFLSASSNVNVASDKATGTVTVTANGENETDNAVLTLQISDEVGNTYYYANTIAVDTLAPQVTVDFGDDVPSTDKYFSEPREATVTIYDLFLVANETKWTISKGTNSEIISTLNPNDATKLDSGAYQVKIPFEEDAEYKFSIVSKDMVGHDANVIYKGQAPTDFVVDNKNPEITITKNDIKAYQSNDTTDFYAGQVVYTVQVSDTNFLNAGLVYTIDGEDKVITLDNGVPVEIKVENGQTLQNIQVFAQDKSGRLGVTTNDAFKQNDDGDWVYIGNDIVVDTDPASVTLTKTAKEGAFVQTYQGTDYYSDAVTYALEISDKFLTADVGEINVELVYQDKADSKTLAIKDLKKADGENVYTTTFDVTDGKALKTITIQVIDNAGNVTKTISCVDADKRTAFDHKDGVNTYTGNPVVVDTTAPTATMTFSENVESFYINGNTVYAILTQPNIAESGIASLLKDEAVTVTIKVNDKNLSIDNENAHGVKANTFKWEGATPVNTASTVTYTATTGQVKADGTALFKIDVRVSDLAGNVLESFNSDKVAGGNFLPVAVEDGAFAYTVSLDRLRPTSGKDDTTAPTITVTPSITPTKTEKDLELFNNAFKFSMNVNDGEKSEKNSGIKSVQWTITDPNEVVKAAQVVNDYAEQTFNADYAIDVALAQALGESNEVSLKVIAIDNVGNQITYQKDFAVDTLAPRVTVTYDNNDVRNEKYFRADRTATISVTDINFEASTTVVTTDVPVTAWVRTGDTYTATATYNTDGEYTFDMTCADKAKNVSAIDYGTSAAPKEFTIDKTAPVLTVHYNPGTPVGTDNLGVFFYDEVVTAIATIEEVNFSAADVRADFHQRSALGNWVTTGNNHVASAIFREGNNYDFSIAYSDLAGNPAVTYNSPTFSVDLTAPTIEITSGNMTTKGLNIVQNDLVLGFTITDAQANLSDFSIKVTHLNNTFKTVEVTGAPYYTIRNADDRTTGYIDMTNIVKNKENDGLYKVEVFASDYAGHRVNLTPSLQFSLNRFGSTFLTDDNFTASFLTPAADGTVYQSGVANKLVIKEINPNKVWQNSQKKEEGSSITIAVNGNSIVLEKGKDFTVAVDKQGTGDNKWFVYTYEIDPAIFQQASETVDGKYSILLYGEDEAGNKNTNESNADVDGNYSGMIEFTLDHKAPIITVLGIESGDSLDAEFHKVEINLSDNTPTGIVVTLNGKEVVLSESMDGLANTAVWLAFDEETGNYVLNIPQENFSQELKIVATDASGNAFEMAVEDILITSNALVRAINNPWIVGGTICLLLLLIALAYYYFKKKNVKAA